MDALLSLLSLLLRKWRKGFVIGAQERGFCEIREMGWLAEWKIGQGSSDFAKDWGALVNRTGLYC